LRPDDKREFAAIPLTLGILGLLGLVLLAFTQGLSVWLALGAILAAVLIATALVGMARPHHPAPSAAPLPSRGATHREDGIPRVLVVADGACGIDDLGAALAENGSAGPTEVLVVAPALGSRTARWTGDDRPYQEAESHLEETLRALGELHVQARGHIGAHDPLQAADDGLREFPADEIVFAVHPTSDANWLERDVVDLARARYQIPVTVVTVGGHGGHAHPTQDASKDEEAGNV